MVISIFQIAQFHNSKMKTQAKKNSLPARQEHLLLFMPENLCEKACLIRKNAVLSFQNFYLTLRILPNPPSPFPERAGGEVCDSPLFRSGEGRGEGFCVR